MPDMTIKEMALSIAIEEMDKDAGEVGSNNSGPFVQKYLNGLAEPPSNWCAGFVSWCYKEAADRLEIEMPFVYSLGARNIFDQFEEEGWLFQEPEEADIVFFWREDINSWMGHIGIVRSIKGKKIITVEGNRGNFPAKVHCYNYTIPPPQFLGYGRVE